MGDQESVVNVSVTFKNVDATEPIKNYAIEKMTHCLKKFSHRDTEVHVVLKVEKNRQIAEVSFRNNGAHFSCKEESGDLYASIDALIETLSKQLRKHKEKISSHH